MTASTFPVFCRLRCIAKGASECSLVDDWLEEAKKRRRSHICEAFREGAARDWISQIVSLWKLDDLSVADLSVLLGISMSQASRLRNHFSTSLGVLGQWAASQDLPFLAPNHCRWSMAGIAAALQAATWLDHIALTRTNRTPLPAKLSECELCLLVVLEATRLQRDWDNLTEHYELDLYAADGDQAFAHFLKRFSGGYLQLMQQHPPAKCRYSKYFPNGQLTDDTRWQLCRDIDALIRKLVFDGSRMWRTVDSLTPWLTGLSGQELEEVA